MKTAQMDQTANITAASVGAAELSQVLQNGVPKSAV
jgi:hypothetical protein